MYDHHVICFRPANPKNTDEWFCRSKAKGMGKVLLTINEENNASIHIYEALGGIWEDTIDACNDAAETILDNPLIGLTKLCRK